MSFNLRCHRCSGWLGEARQAMKLVGLFENPREVERVRGPRDTWRCKCGWANVFEPVEASAPAAGSAGSWRTTEVKQHRG